MQSSLLLHLMRKIITKNLSLRQPPLEKRVEDRRRGRLRDLASTKSSHLMSPPPQRNPKAQVTSENEIPVRKQSWEPTMACEEDTDKEIAESFRPAKATQ